MGQSMIGFFGGERKRGQYIVMRETIENAEKCLNYCISHEVIISEEVNMLFIESDEIITKEIKCKEKLNLHLMDVVSKYNKHILFVIP